MRLRLIAVAIAAMFAAPGAAWCAKALPDIPAWKTERDAAAESATTATTAGTGSGSKRAVLAAGDRPYTSRPAPSRPRSPVDRSASDPGAGTFKAFDANQDGYLSRDEARESAELYRRFTALDKDGDGKLSMAEVTGWRSASYGSADTSVTRVETARPDVRPSGHIPPTLPVRPANPSVVK